MILPLAATAVDGRSDGVPAPFADRTSPATGPVGADGVPELLRAPRADASPAPAGLRIFVDPLDGHIVAHPPAERHHGLQRMVEESFRLRPDRGEPYTFTLPNGGTGAWVGDRFMTSAVVTVGPDGSFHVGCAHGPGAHPPDPGHDAPTPTPSAPVK